MKIIKIIIKDLKVLFSDKKALAIMILMPIILSTILSLALRGSFANSDNTEFQAVKVAVVKNYNIEEDFKQFKLSLKNNFILKNINQNELEKLVADDTNPEEIFFEDFLNSKDITKYISYQMEEEAKAIELLNKEKISAIIILPNKFIYDMKINLLTPFRNNIEIKVLTHPDKNISGKIVKTIIDAYSNTMSSVIIGKNIIIEKALENNSSIDQLTNINTIIEEMTDAMKAIDVNIEDVVLEKTKSINSADYYSVGIMTMFILFAAGQGGRMLLEEKDNLTYQRMMVGGVSKFEILTGKFTSVYLIAIFQIFVMTIYSHYALKVDWGNIFAIAVISITAGFAVAGLGSFIGALTYSSGNYKMANMFENILIQVMALLGGSFFPLDVLPHFMQKLSFLSLNGVALKAYLKIITGYTTNDILSYILILIIQGTLFTIFAVVILKGGEGKLNVKYNKAKTFKA